MLCSKLIVREKKTQDQGIYTRDTQKAKDAPTRPRHEKQTTRSAEKSPERRDLRAINLLLRGHSAPKQLVPRSNDEGLVVSNLEGSVPDRLPPRAQRHVGVPAARGLRALGHLAEGPSPNPPPAVFDGHFHRNTQPGHEPAHRSAGINRTVGPDGRIFRRESRQIALPEDNIADFRDLDVGRVQDG